MNEDYNILLNKLNRFRIKYYLNKLLRGLALSALLLMVLFIAVDIFEYYSWSNSGIRTALFYIYLIVALSVFGVYVFTPLFHLLRMGKIISHAEAANIIGNHFPDIADKLLNTLQLLSEVEKNGSGQTELLLAGIEQKTNNLKPFSFRKAISYKSNYKYLKWLAGPFTFLIIVLIISPAFVTGPVNRIVNHGEKFEKPKPYTFNLVNSSLECVQGDNFTVLVNILGEEVPEYVYVNDGKYDFRLIENQDELLEYTFSKLKTDIYFYIASDEYSSEQFHLKVLPKPSIFNFDLELEFPAYLNKKDELVESTGDIVVPEGTKLNWRFYANNSKQLVFMDNTTTNISSANSKTLFEHSLIAIHDFSYSVFGISEHGLHSDTLDYSVNVIKDDKPSIVIDNMQQENLLGYILTAGSISDDYGFSSLRYYYRKSESESWLSNRLEIVKNVEKQNFNHSFITKELDLAAGDKMEFYYEVWDNDAVNGYKSSKTKVLYFSVPDRNEIKNESDRTSNQMKSKYEKSIADLDKLSEELEQLKKTVFEKKDLDWSDKKKFNDIIKEEQQLREQLQEMQELNKKREELKEFLQENQDPDIQEKLDKINEQIEKLNNQEILDKLEKLMENIDELSKDQLDQLLGEMKDNQEEFKEDLEQQLEFFKQLELEQKMSESIDKLNKLAKDQEELAQQTKDKENKLDKALEEQEGLKKEFDDLKKDLDEIDKLNSELEKSLDLDTNKSDQEEVDKDMDESVEKLDSGKRKKASESQKSASEKMKKMAEELQLMMESAQASRMGEDIEQMANILDNLMDISFNLEKLIAEILTTSDNDPKFLTNTQNLKILKDDYVVLHDSLIEISKRQMMIKDFVVKESNKVESYMNKSLSNIQERQIHEAGSNLQYSMTSANNLALMLDESLNNMKNSMKMPGSKSSESECDQPGQSQGESMKEMMKMQQKLGKGLKPSPMPGGKDGKSGKGKEGESRELAKMAAQQSELRKQMRDLMNQIEGEGGNGSALQKIIDKMEMQEQDIVNKRISSETLERQKEIESRLLMADRALQEREKEQKREASAGKKQERSNNIDELKYKDISGDNYNNVINSSPLKLSTPYKKLLKKYLYEIEN